ncbi:hypothetical protein GUJ93_ZPchr0008g12996 [Zizania palustris]|uniref:Uncharacterized protein n=1 Tax=Zizania palustris TaxID=103762 RepID=A0A8J5RC39_ZIZPA|nr:hypothetical protein GUJ93_ZPchr0008g12996 [Zizania palustris]
MATRLRRHRVQENFFLFLTHSGRHRIRRALSTSVATTAPPHRGHAPGAFLDPVSLSSSTPHHPAAALAAAATAIAANLQLGRFASSSLQLPL